MPWMPLGIFLGSTWQAGTQTAWEWLSALPVGLAEHWQVPINVSTVCKTRLCHKKAVAEQGGQPHLKSCRPASFWVLFQPQWSARAARYLLQRSCRAGHLFEWHWAPL